MARTKRFSGRFNLRLPEQLHAQVAKRAAREGMSMNTLCLWFIATGLKAKE